VPVQYSYTSTPLSACTVQLYLYSPYGPYGLYRASVPVQGCIFTFTFNDVSAPFQTREDAQTVQHNSLLKISNKYGMIYFFHRVFPSELTIKFVYIIQYFDQM